MFEIATVGCFYSCLVAGIWAIKELKSMEVEDGC
jgi:hypothetical protein